MLQQEGTFFKLSDYINDVEYSLKIQQIKRYIYVHLDVWFCNFGVCHFISQYQSTLSSPEVWFFPWQRHNA
jgi:uncharacterized protein YutD